MGVYDCTIRKCYTTKNREHLKSHQKSCLRKYNEALQAFYQKQGKDTSTTPALSMNESGEAISSVDIDVDIQNEMNRVVQEEKEKKEARKKAREEKAMGQNNKDLFKEEEEEEEEQEEFHMQIE